MADRTKDRDQARANRQKQWEDRRAKKAEREAARKAKREAAASADAGRTTLGQAVSKEAQRRWEKRRADAMADKAGTEKVSLTKEKDRGTVAKGADGKSAKEPPAGGSSTGESSPAADESGKAGKATDGASAWLKQRRRSRRRADGAGRAGRRDRTRRTRHDGGRAGRTGRAGRRGRRGRPSDSPFGPPPTPTVEWPEHTSRPTRPANAGDGVVDAEIVDDADSSRPMGSPRAVTTGVKGLPPAPERHTARPGTTRDTPKETPVSSSSPARARSSGRSNLSARHQTDITLDQFLVGVANIALSAASHKELAEELVSALESLAGQLEDMAADLADDHNIDEEITDRLSDLRDATAQMKVEAQRCAQECESAWEVAKIAAWVRREDLRTGHGRQTRCRPGPGLLRRPPRLEGKDLMGSELVLRQKGTVATSGDNGYKSVQDKMSRLAGKMEDSRRDA